MMFLLPRNDVTYPRHLTSEPCEHCFGSYRCICREFTILQVSEVEEKREKKINAMYESDLKIKRLVDARIKGYQATFVEFTEASKKGDISRNVGLINVSTKKPAVDQVWYLLKSVIEDTNISMIPVLGQYGVKKGIDISVF